MAYLVILLVILLPSKQSVAQALAGDGVVVVPGFYGVDRDGKATLFGRGGSDYSAASIACCIAAESLDVWKDVDGFLSADPGTVTTPRSIAQLNYLEAAELFVLRRENFASSHCRTLI